MGGGFMKKISIPCNFNGTVTNCPIYIGSPEASHNPISFQADWLSKERGGSVSPEVMDSLDKLLKIAVKNNVSFADLCEYALVSTSKISKPAEPSAAIQNNAKESTEQVAQTASSNSNDANHPQENGIKIATAKKVVVEQ